jgi:hypothetical protein
MATGSAPPFPAEHIAWFGLACAVAGAAALLTHFNGNDLRLWWSARHWAAAQCTLVRLEPDVLYRYQANGKTYESGALEIGSAPGEITGAVSGKQPGAVLNCWFNPSRPGQSLLSREYEGWWWLPGAWLLAAFLLLSTLPPLLRGLWAWLVYKPDPPLTWAQWFATFYQDGAWAYSIIGLCCLIPGLTATKFMTIDTWWNWFQAQNWKPTECTITRSAVRGWSGGSGRERTGGYILETAFTYEFDGKTYTGSEYSPWRLGKIDWLLQSSRREGPGSIAELLERLAPGSRQTCYVSPRDPRRAYLSRGKDPFGTYVSCIGPFLSLLGLVILCARR